MLELRPKLAGKLPGSYIPLKGNWLRDQFSTILWFCQQIFFGKISPAHQGGKPENKKKDPKSPNLFNLKALDQLDGTWIKSPRKGERK